MTTKSDDRDREACMQVTTEGSATKQYIHNRNREAFMLWYTFSIRKDDPENYKKSQDMFSTMVLTHGLLPDMTLWMKCKLAIEEDMFFAHIPEDMNVTDEAFFRAFPSTKCNSPSKGGLSLLVGNSGGHCY